MTHLYLIEKFVFFAVKTARLSLTVSLARGILFAGKVCQASKVNVYIYFICYCGVFKWISIRIDTDVRLANIGF